MNVYLKPESWLGIGIKRVAAALTKHKPDDVTIVDDPKDADLTVLHIVGHGGWTPAKDLARPVAVIQYCHLTSEDSSLSAWAPLWSHAKAVWSYYDLAAVVRAACETHPSPDVHWNRAMNFYHAPLGVDADVFRDHQLPRSFTIGTSGYIASTESVDDCAAAAAAIAGRVFHLGPNLKLGSHVESHTGIPDQSLAVFYSKCQRVSGLRRVEGFELPVVEGLCCGARPVVFDAPHYRQWFGGHAEYVPEVSSPELIPILTELFRQAPQPVTKAERAHVVNVFDWKRISLGFWERVR